MIAQQQNTSLILQSLGDATLNFLLQLTIALGIILVGVVIAGTLKQVVRKILSFMGKTKDLGVGISERTADLLSALIFWVVVLMFLTTATKAIGFEVGAQVLGAVLGYIPNVLIAVITVIVGSILARIVKGTVAVWVERSGLAHGAVVGNIVEAILVLFAVIIGVDQLGINTNILVSNINIILGGFVLAFALSFGLGVKDLVGNIVASYYVKQMYKVGSRVKVGNVAGEIKQITNMAVIIKTEQGDVTVPNKEFVTARITAV